jgi:two-component system chemotaxis response regulator CheB
MSKLIVIGGSFGAINALKIILADLPVNFPAAILIVTHIGANNSVLPDILGRVSQMPVRHATDGEPIIPGRILLAPPDQHLTVEMVDKRLYARLVHGPKENHCRPAIDPLFRSAAATCGVDTVGLVLTGYLDDGTVGLQAVKVCGGTAIVQDPTEAEGPEMPSSALRHVDVDMKLSLNEIGPTLVELLARTQTRGTHFEYGKPQVPDWIDI